MSETESPKGDIAERTREEKLRALVRKDLNPKITAMAEKALERRQERSS